MGSNSSNETKAIVSNANDSTFVQSIKYHLKQTQVQDPSVTAKDALTRGKAITQSPTKDSQTLSNEADEVFILRDNETLQKQELLILQNYKRRDAARVLDDIYLRKRFEVSALIYDESQQALDSVMNLSRQQAIADLMADSDESGYDLD